MLLALFYPLHVVLNLLLLSLSLVLPVLLLTLDLLDGSWSSFKGTTSILLLLLLFQCLLFPSLFLLTFASLKCIGSFLAVLKDHVRVMQAGLGVVRFVQAKTTKTISHHIKLPLLLFICPFVFLLFLGSLPRFEFVDLNSFYFLCLEVGLPSLLSLPFLSGVLLFFSLQPSKGISEPELSIFLVLLGPLLILKLFDPVLHFLKLSHLLSLPLILKCLLHPPLQFLYFPFLPLNLLPNFMLLILKLRPLLHLLSILNPIPLLFAGDLVNLLIMKLLLFGLLNDLLLVGFIGAGLCCGVVELIDGLHLNDLNNGWENYIGS